MRIQIYDSPNWIDKYERGKLLIEFINTGEILNCTSIKIFGQSSAIFYKVYNVDEDLIEIWVKGNITIKDKI